ncbi:MAG TPA: hypothetical protein VGO94_13195 [Mycobacteriales bacterium]|nr:hypothetical protein [Mycobacteriales bacterium]
MTPETKQMVTFRQRRSVPSGDSGPVDPAADTGATARARPDTDTDTDAATDPAGGPSSAEGPATAGDRLRRTYRNPQSPASPRRLAAVSLWSLLLVLGGAVAYLYALLGQLNGTGTGLAGSVLSLVSFGDLVGLALILASMLTIGKRRAPWILLGTATGLLLVLLVLAAVA